MKENGSDPSKSKPEQIIESAAQHVSHLASLATHQLEEGLHRGTKHIDQLRSVIEEQSREAARTADFFVHENPWRSVGIAAAVGMVVGLLLRRR